MSSNSKTLIGSNFVFTNRNNSNVVFSSGPNESIVLKNALITVPNIELRGTDGSGSFSTGITTKITNSVVNATQSINATAADMQWDSTNSNFLLNRIGGTYLVEIIMTWNANSSGSREVSFQVNGTTRSAVRMASGGGVVAAISTSVLLPNIQSVQTVNAWAVQDSGSTLSSGAPGIQMNCYRIA